MKNRQNYAGLMEDKLNKFFTTLKTVCVGIVEKDKKKIGDEAKKHLNELISLTFGKVEENSKGLNVLGNYFMITNEIEIAKLIELELDYFNTRFSENNYSFDDVSYLNDFIDNGMTIKDSLEDFLKNLPNWLKKILKIINEILGIAKTLIW